MAIQRLGLIMNGVTGRMGTNQHLIRSIAAIRAEGGVALSNGDIVTTLVARWAEDSEKSTSKVNRCSSLSILSRRRRAVQHTVMKAT